MLDLFGCFLVIGSISETSFLVGLLSRTRISGGERGYIGDRHWNEPRKMSGQGMKRRNS